MVKGRLWICAVGNYQLPTLPFAQLSTTNKNRMPNGHPIFVVRSTGIEDIRRYEKSLDFQGLFAVERQNGRQTF
jgi:hypothetical protein